MANDEIDEFGLSSGDESDLVAAFNVAEKKRKHEGTGDGPPTKKLALYPSTSALGVKILKENFNLPSFRLEQEAVVARLLSGGNAVVVFPTGAGKSICYQVPAVAFAEQDKESGSRAPGDNGVSIVVSPLIALMKDQVDALQRRGINAVSMDSSKSRDEFLQQNANIRGGRVRLLYCAPEKLNNEGFIASIKQVRGGVRLVAIDEAHCISEWGHSFRPDYLKVARFVKEIKAERVICLTATATPKVANDAFDVDPTGLFKTTVYRPNLRLVVEATKSKQDKYPRIFKFLKAHRGPTIIYVTLQKQSEQLADDLRQQGFNARSFHAGMETEAKSVLQDQFMRSESMVICATIAFGMGIDKPNIRNVIHFDIPSSIEGYSQQIGRAGRDGLPSNCVFYLCSEDFYLRDVFVYGDLPSIQSIRRLLTDICSSANTRLDVGDTFEVSQYSQGKEFDIRATTLGILYAYLELRFGLIRAVTPKYSTYSFEAKAQYYSVSSSDRHPAAVAISKLAKKAAKYHHIDVDIAGDQPGLRRFDIIQKLNQWNESGILDLKPSGVRHVYKLVRKLPSTPEELDDIAVKIFAQMQERELQDLQRTKDVVCLVTDRSCISRGLAAYFGDTSTSLRKDCGHCSWCETRKPVVLASHVPEPTSHVTIAGILDVVPERDDPRFLARVAFGIHSPRITAAKLQHQSVYGSLANHDFGALLRTFTAACDDANEREETVPAAKARLQSLKPPAKPPAKSSAKSPARKSRKFRKW